MLQVILRVLDQQESLADAVAAPRVHHQWLPDVVFYEEARSPLPSLLSDLAGRGYELKPRDPIGDISAIHVTPRAIHAVADDRRRGKAGTTLVP